MTAIFGIIQHDQTPIRPETLQAAADSLRHQAEHGLDIWQNGNIALGQALTRFWSNSAPTPAPEHDNEHGLTLVADARLDNRAELADRLGISRSDLPSIPDNRLLLHAYKAWGEDTPRRLLGDFVFAVWDERHKSLFAARDPIGIRWLYYYAGQRRFSFASDLAGLLELMDEAPRIDPRSLDEFLSSYTTNYPIRNTFYKNALKLHPGQAILLENQRARTWYYWQAENIQPNPALKDPREGVEILRILLREAVAFRAETVDRLGSHLSGGLDSSALTALAVDINRKADRPDPLAFSWSPSPETCPLMEMDERVYIQRIAEYLSIPVTYSRAMPKTDILHASSDPSILPINTLLWEHNVMENARSQGARVLLSGWGGDELAFSRGIGYPSGLIKQGRLLALVRYLKMQYGWNFKGWLSGLYMHGLYPLLPGYWQARLPLDLKRERDPQKRKMIKARAQARFQLPLRQFFQSEFYTWLEQNHTPTFEWIPAGLRNSQKWYLTKLLGRVESWAAWSARLGARHAYPLLDQRVVEFALSMPEDWVYHGGKLRKFGKQAIKDVLPAQFFEGRDKQDRALFSLKTSPEHQAEVTKQILAALAAQKSGEIPANEWIDFENLAQALNGKFKPDFEIKRNNAILISGLQELTQLAFLDQRATLRKE
ncbi:MAG: asparagine synthase-related protein [Anaerolineae bacterium]|nr:asparagine synthase-related protein [Anaerolineae bacterium]